MSNKKLAAKSLASERVRSPQQRRLSWLDVSSSALLVLVVTVPTMAVEEDWHGHPMIDQPSHLWLAAAILVLAAFVAGGLMAGYRRPTAAGIHATVAAAIAVAVLLVGAFARRHWLVHEGLPGAVVRLWCLGGLTAIVVSAAGSQVGRRLAPGKR
jgi:hypothetical protein